jgi:hypothetical protein
LFRVIAVKPPWRGWDLIIFAASHRAFIDAVIAETLERRAVIDRVMARLQPVPRLPAFRRLPVADVEQSPGKPVERDSRLTVPRSFSAPFNF